MESLPNQAILNITQNLSDRLFSDQDLLDRIQACCAAHPLPQTEAALAFAAKSHAGQFRKPGHTTEKIPYLYHPLMLTCHAISLDLMEDDILAVCLLHDVCEDCNVPPEALPVGPSAREAVRLLTKPSHFPSTPEAESAYYAAIATNPTAALVKLLDRCNNISSMCTSFPKEKIASYVQETMTYLYPLFDVLQASHPAYQSALFSLRYHMDSVLSTIRHLFYAELHTL